LSFLTGSARKSSDLGRTNNTIAADSDLVFTPAADSYYLITIVARIYANATADFKWDIDCSGADIWRAMYCGTPNVEAIGDTVVNGFSAINRNTASLGVASTLNGDNTGTFSAVLEIRGLLKTGGSPGDFEFRWAQNTTNGTAATVFAGSYMTWEQIEAP
jgi:hypothetical protein